MLSMKWAYLALILILSQLVAADLHYVANLSGQQQVPPVATIGEGSAELELDDDTLEWDISYDNLESGVISAHIHGPAMVGENAADHVIELEVDEDSTSGEISGSAKLNEEQIQWLKTGMLYINIHTNDNPNGEIRGQIYTTAVNFKATLEGSQEVPPVTTDASGSAKITIDPDTLEISVDIDYSVDGANGAHIHGPAMVGNNAEPLIIFEDFDSPIRDKFSLTPLQAIYLRTGMMYINIHSTAHPNGEIRGQIVVDEDGGDSSSWFWFGLVTVIVALIVVAIIAAIGYAYYKKKDKINDLVKRYSKKSDSSTGEARLSQFGGATNEPLLDLNNC